MNCPCASCFADRRVTRSTRSARSTRARGRPGAALQIQSIIFPRDLWKLAEAKAWTKRHGYAVWKVDTTKTSYRFRQIDPSAIRKGTMRTISFGKGIKAVVGRV